MDIAQENGFKQSSGSKNHRTNGRACAHCHQRKVKCDIVSHGSPCTNCESRHITNCHIYEAKKRRSRRTIDTLSCQLKPITPRIDTTTNIPPTTSMLAPTNPNSTERLNSVPSTNVPSHTANGIVHDEGNIAEFIDQEDLRASEITNAKRNCYVGTGVSNFNYLTRQSTVQPLGNDCFHFANRQFRPSLTTYRLQLMPSDILKRPAKPLADKLVNAYFLHINRGWPIIDEEDFRAKYEGQDPNYPMALPLLNAVFLVGAHVLAAQDGDFREHRGEFFHRAKTLLDHRFEQDRVAHIQAALLLTWYSDGLEEIVANAWHWIGIACRVALGMGIHRNAAPSRLQLVSKRTWTRLWWVLFQFDTMISCAYGRPQALHLDESDVPDLEPRHFDGVPNADVDFVIQHTRLCIIISRAVRKRWALRETPESRAAATREADEALAQFLSNLPSSLGRIPSNINQWQATLHLSYNNALILLHRPSPLEQTRSHSLDEASDTAICSDAVHTLATVFESLQSQALLNKLWLNGTYTLFTAIVHASNTLGSSNAVLAAKSSQMFDTLLTTLRELSRYWQFALGLLRLFETRLLKVKASTAEGQRAPRSDLDHSEHVPEITLRPSHSSQTAAGQVRTPTIHSDIGMGNDIDDFPPLDDILLDNILFPDDDFLQNFLAGHEDVDQPGLAF